MNIKTIATTYFRSRRKYRGAPAAIGLTTLVLLFASAQAAVAPPMEDAQNFATLAASAISNTGSTIVTGDIGIHPNDASSVNGFPPGQVSGTDSKTSK